MNRSYLLILIVLFGSVAFGESWRPTTTDLYMKSYDQALGAGAPSVTATQRGEAYKSQYEICDQDHNCSAMTNQPQITTPGDVDREDETMSKTRVRESVKAFLHVPMWQ